MKKTEIEGLRLSSQMPEISTHWNLYVLFSIVFSTGYHSLGDQLCIFSPRQSDSIGNKLHSELEKTNKKQEKANTVLLAMQTIKTGVIPEKFQVHPKGGAVDVTVGAEPGTIFLEKRR